MAVVAIVALAVFGIFRISGKIGWTEIMNDILRPPRLWCLCLPGLRPEPFRFGLLFRQAVPHGLR